ncbi:D-aminoacyl-tRNA deacylase [bacterium HR36]|uniref:TatD DNase family protein n=1 Tax=uncultured Planctomycetota bacterium TaxID=120965 RepID=H5SII5_9BACT|nr:TatD DNase family protein [uncultured Planctomycetota bacterium]GBD37141.1 D-aminoacyl-tRNA deacylase [bacterium HR36]
MQLFDTHAHLDDAAFANDLTQVIQRAQDGGVIGILAVGISAASSEAVIRLAEKFPMVWAAVGIHPNYAAQAQAEDWWQIEKLAQHPKVVAIGETGLDRYWDYTPFALQEEYFVRHLALARQTGRPIVIHCREAEADLRRILQQDYDVHGSLKGILHAFSGEWATAEFGLAMGLHVSFAGMVTFRNAEDLRQVAARIPAQRLLIETDSPYLTPVPLRGKVSRNEPAHIVHTLTCLAQVRQVEPTTLAAETTANARHLLGIDSAD